MIQLADWYMGGMSIRRLVGLVAAVFGLMVYLLFLSDGSIETGHHFHATVIGAPVEVGHESGLGVQLRWVARADPFGVIEFGTVPAISLLRGAVVCLSHKQIGLFGRNRFARVSDDICAGAAIHQDTGLSTDNVQEAAR